ncbi:hypothetical protein ABB37_08531 [Leptomonas pyrrhocoris]|uniref:Uncharacterized protein n=1 Tax=Leptomonas pyrrhocoris TaxID=157538 RepID=A0A0M9FSY3_LEPPY|nr:hypothetical protein ABB37_08531 [Leptomonas pyrrhocoris]KPA75216.1 hypothetical protein ABB37_08531 [Leptomonas pyrrhocoris]|eukprot:XP_015653655.1 hypothetical protein ABB37_08531 [Leptomonas pyrrhocoris]
MDYMQLEYHNPAAELTPQEVVFIHHAAAAKRQEIIAAARALRRIIESGEGSADLHRVLERFSASVNITHIPKRFMEKTPMVSTTPTAATTSRSKKHLRRFHRETHNRNYLRRLHRQRKTSVTESHFFQVPSSPLPLSFAAQQDIERTHGSQSRRRGPTGSGYAPLFTKASTSPLASRELSPTERASLQFLTPAKRSPKTESLARHTPSDPKARMLFNEPKRMPNLHRRVPPDFKAACAERYTCCSENHCTGNGERVAQNSVASVNTPWY